MKQLKDDPSQSQAVSESIEQVKKMNLFKLMIPAVFEMAETSLKNLTLSMISTSVTQMMRSTLVVFSAFLAIIFLKKKLYKHHFVSMFVIVAGIFLGGISQAIHSKEDGKDVRFDPLGIIVVLVAQLFGSTCYVVEEKFMGDFDHIDPMFMIGMEGLWAFLFWLILLPIF